MNLFYDQTAGCLCNADGVRTIVKPALRYKENPLWNITVLTGSTAADLSSVETFRAAVDVDFSAGTDVMCRTLNAGIDQTGKASGVLKVALDCNTTTFLTAVDGNSEKTAWFELWGFNSAGNACFYLRFPIIVSGVVDPDSGPVPSPVQNGIADAAQISAMLVNKANATHTHAAEDISVANMEGATVQTELQNQKSQIDQKAAASHTHTASDISDMPDIPAAPEDIGAAAATHSHVATDITDLGLVAVSDSYKDLTISKGAWTAIANSTVFTASTNGFIKLKSNPGGGQPAYLYLNSEIVAGGGWEGLDGMSHVLWWLIPVAAGDTYKVEVSSTQTFGWFSACQ